MQGHRVYANEHGFLPMDEGDYGQDGKGEWWARCPGARAGASLSDHTIEEHEDGTITCSPSPADPWRLSRLSGSRRVERELLMATLLASPCRTPRCPERAGPGGLCAAHRRRYERRPQRVADKRFYASPGWRALRAFVLARDPRCDCGGPSEQADHIVPRSQGGSDDPSNLKGKCGGCHSRKTANENRGDGGRWG
jgi:5-methylcytosine-specific restriction protein A